jgi:flagellar protein FlaI
MKIFINTLSIILSFFKEIYEMQFGGMLIIIIAIAIIVIVLGVTFNLFSASVETNDFEVIPTGIPMPGTPIKDLNITYEVNPPFQYAKVIYENNKVSYHSIEPILSKSEIKCIESIKDTFNKVRSNIVITDFQDREKRIEYLKTRFIDTIKMYRFKLNEIQKDKLFHEIVKEYVNFGKIDALMNDPYIEDITCNGPNEFIYINHRIYESIPTNIKFDNETELNNFVLKIVQSTGRHISVLQPIRDATLPDGSRISIAFGKEVTKKGSTFTIRKFKKKPISPIELIKYGTFDSMQMAYLWIAIEYKKSLLAVGGTASGKTATLNAICSFIRPENKIISIEDTAELNILHPNWMQSVVRTGFGSEKDSSGEADSIGSINIYALLKIALRQRPKYIIVGEVRGDEAYSLFQAMSLGHSCFGTIHAGSMKELLSRVESKPMNITRNLFSNVDIIIFNSMMRMGEHHVRKATSIIEIDEIDPIHNDLITNTIYKWNPTTDIFEFFGNSIIFEQIQEDYGISVEYLMSEMHNRAKLLDELVEKNITDYNSVVDIIHNYMRDKDAMIEEVKKS